MIDKAPQASSKNEVDPRKHLESLRNIYTPLIESFSEQVDPTDESVFDNKLSQPRTCSKKDFDELRNDLMFYCHDREVFKIVLRFLDDEEKLQVALFNHDQISDNDATSLSFEEFRKGETHPFLSHMLIAAEKFRYLFDEISSEEYQEEYFEGIAEAAIFMVNNIGFSYTPPDYLRKQFEKGEIRAMDYALKKFGNDLPTAFSNEVEFIFTDCFPEVIILPVGQYGKDFSKRLGRTIQKMLSQIDNVEATIIETSVNYSEIVEHTARGQSLKEGESYVDAVKKALSEGIVSLGQALALLTAEKQPSFQDIEALIDNIVSEKLLTKLAYQIPPGTIGPITLEGKFIKNLLVVDEEGKLVISPNITFLANEAKRIMRSDMDKKKIDNDNYTGLASAGMGCPVAYQGPSIPVAGIDILSEAFLKVFKNTK